MRIRVSTTIDAPPDVVWDAIEDIERHVDWMDDAVAIRLTSKRRSGIGTTFDCDTRVGPIRLTDRFEITEWKPGKVMGIHHLGVVTGTGRFLLKRARGGRTRFTWDETLSFPWWLGGRLAGLPGRPVLRRVFGRDVRNLKALVETGRGPLLL